MQFEESEILELKRSTSELKEAIISIVAILNKHQRGELYFGIRNDGEAVINAFCHRDYNKYDSVNIAVFKDRLEIRNPGRDGEGDVLKYSNNSIVQMTTCFFRYLLSSFYCVAHCSKCHVKGKGFGVAS
jgi:ATP-dependent DNA helicase RecG